MGSVSQFTDTGRSGGQSQMSTYFVVGDPRGINFKLFFVQRVLRQIDAIVVVHVILVIDATIHLETVELACRDIDVESVVHVA